MIGDSARFNAYAKAISRSVRTRDVVAEIGCGPAVFALLACQAGAKRVYAIETEDIIDVARQIVAAIGFAERIQFFQDDSRKVELARKFTNLQGNSGRKQCATHRTALWGNFVRKMQPRARVELATCRLRIGLTRL